MKTKNNFKQEYLKVASIIADALIHEYNSGPFVLGVTEAYSYGEDNVIQSCGFIMKQEVAKFLLSISTAMQEFHKNLGVNFPHSIKLQASKLNVGFKFNPVLNNELIKIMTPTFDVLGQYEKMSSATKNFYGEDSTILITKGEICLMQSDSESGEEAYCDLSISDLKLIAECPKEQK